MNYKKIILKLAPSVVVLIVFSLFSLHILGANAQGVQTLSSPNSTEDPTQTSFRVVVCDGPALPTKDLQDAAQAEIDQAAKNTGVATHTYVVCNFNGAMIQVQHLIDIAMVLGVFAAIVLFTYAGFLMLTGKEDDRKKAKDIFPKIFIGFIIMLSAWFIVYQILSWLTGNGTFTKLLGNP